MAVIQMNYEAMEDMIAELERGIATLRAIEAEALILAVKVEREALQGQAGEALAEAMKIPLRQSIARLQDKLAEMQEMARTALYEMRDAT